MVLHGFLWEKELGLLMGAMRPHQTGSFYPLKTAKSRKSRWITGAAGKKPRNGNKNMPNAAEWRECMRRWIEPWESNDSECVASREWRWRCIRKSRGGTSAGNKNRPEPPQKGEKGIWKPGKCPPCNLGSAAPPLIYAAPDHPGCSPRVFLVASGKK